MCSSFKDNIFCPDLQNMQLISKYNKGIWYLLCVTNVFSKYAWVFPLKDKKGVIITNAFQNILGKSTRKPNKICIDKVNEVFMWKYQQKKNIFVKGYTPNWWEDVFIGMDICNRRI